jgi:hypothetical protein
MHFRRKGRRSDFMGYAKEEIQDLFLLQCKKCGSTDVSIFPSSYDGDITICCNNCDSEKEF